MIEWVTVSGLECAEYNPYGMEIDPAYIDVIIERFCNYAKADKEAIYASATN